MGKEWKQWQNLFSWAPKSLRTLIAVMKLKDACPLKENCEKTAQHIKKQRHHFAEKSPYNQSYGFFSSPLWMWVLDNKEDWHQASVLVQTSITESWWHCTLCLRTNHSASLLPKSLSWIKIQSITSSFHQVPLHLQFLWTLGHCLLGGPGIVLKSWGDIF